MRYLSIALACLMACAGNAGAQEVQVRQVQTVDYRVQATVAIDSMSADLAALDASYAEVKSAADSLASLYSRLSADIDKAVTAADRLRRSPQERTAASGYQDDLIRAVDDLQKLQSELRAEFLALQQQVQNESRRYQTISNALRARHDMAMNSVRNMK